MKYRFSQCRRIADRLTTQSMRALGAGIAGEVQPEELRVVVFNPLPRPLAETAELTLQIPTDWPMFNEFFGFEPKPSFRIYDAGGQEIAYQRLGQAMHRTVMRVAYDRFAGTFPAHDVAVSLPLSVPAMGYTTLTVRAGERGLPTRHPEVPGLATSERSMANESLSVTIEPNGTLTLTDLRSGQTYARLLTYEDVADIGDGWYHGIAVNDQAYVSTAARADVALVHNGPMMTAFRIRTTMGVPAEFRFDSMTRSNQLVDLVIDSLVTLRPGAERLEVQTTVHNVADDHRLRVLLPSGAEAAGTYLADSPFDVVERPIALRADNHLYRELEVETRPQQTWTAVYADDRGLALVSAGQMESAVRDLPERPLALTLFRGTRRTVMTGGEPNGQLRGELVFRYWIVPLADAPDPVRLCALGQQLAAPLRDVQLRSEDLAIERAALSAERTLPPSAGFLSVEGAAVVSSVRQVGGGMEVRLWNPTPEAVRAILRLTERPQAATQPTQAQYVNLESAPLAEPEPIEAGALEVSLGPKQIVTLRLLCESAPACEV
jgi:alpha-mannosidase/mannosylglycerate hydrolase